MRGAGEAEEPLVSVLTASYNSSQFIAETLDSALGQTYERLEVIVADDRSTDSTPAIVRDYAQRHPGRVKVVEATERAGPCRRRNDALAAAEGSLICWLDHDDLWDPTKVEKQVEVMRRRPAVGLVHTGFELFDSVSGETVPGRTTTEARSGDLLRPLYVEGDFIGSLTAMFRREALDRAGGRLWDKEFAYGDDWFAWLVISLDWQTEGIDEVLARYRMHGDNLSFKYDNHHLKGIRLMREFTDDFPEAREKLGRWRRIGIGRRYLEAAKHEARHGSRARAPRYWLAGAIRAPSGALLRPLRNLGARLTLTARSRRGRADRERLGLG
jgi:glycosyltransferase involved in cell wall biosynthesis